jgi:hypothetical protein
MFLGRCAEQWRRRYIEGDKFPPGIALHIGSGFHKAAEVNYEGKLLTRLDEPLDVCVDAAVTEYDAKLDQLGLMLPKEEVGDAAKIMGEGKDAVVGFTEEWHKIVAPIYQPQFIEEKFLIDLPGVNKPFLGFIDLYSEQGTLSDLKSGARAWTQDRADGATQMTLYREAIRQKTGQYPAKMRFDTVIEYSNGFFYEPFETTRDQQDLEILINKAKIMERMIEAECYPPANPDSWSCNAVWCGYFHTCQYMKRKVIIDVGR